MTLVTFVIPVRHPSNAPDWGALTRRLTETIRSISAQTCDDWSAVIVANENAALPDLPQQVSVERVDFPPNPVFTGEGVDLEASYEAVRLDKGKRILAGMLRHRTSRYFMVVDDDDMISNRLVAFVRDHSGGPGWKIGSGYLWSERSHLVVTQENFSNLCGTSHIVRSDLLALPGDAKDADIAFVKRSLGSHIFLAADLAEAGHPLDVLPFRGAIYRVGHAGAHSKSVSVLRNLIFRRNILRSPRRLAQNIRRFRPLSSKVRTEFFGLMQLSAVAFSAALIRFSDQVL